jgi:hypothetical protein
LNPETRAYLASAQRDAACSHASSRRQGAGDGSQEITTPAKLRHLQDALYRKAKAEPNYRFWSLYGELTRRDLLEHALRLVARNGGAPGVDGESLGHITPAPDMERLPRRAADRAVWPVAAARTGGVAKFLKSANRMLCDEATRKAGYGKPVRPV